MRSASLLGASLLVVLATACGDDGGNNNNGTCGDGHVTGSEQCDDGNTTSGDGCSATCTTESTTGHCGDNVVDVATEQCDDGNTVSGDGCSATCQNENPPNNCGNGVVDTGEQCDDHNNANTDGCSSTCTVEQGYMCTGMPSVCTMTQTATGTCAMPLQLTFTGTTMQTATASGDTTGATDQVGDAPCDEYQAEGMGGHDQVLTFTTTDTRDVKLTLTPGATFDGLIRVTSTVCMPSTEITDNAGDDGCSDAGLDGDPEVLTYTALPAGTYYVTVDGYDDTALGTWSLSVTANLSTCGDGVVDANEGCDDGGHTNGNGCSAACTVEPGYTCTGAPSTCTATPGSCASPKPLTLAMDQGSLVGHGTGDTTNTMNGIPDSDCDVFGTGGGNDESWTFTTTDTRDVVITLNHDTVFDGSIRLMTTTCDPTTEVVDEAGGDGCSDSKIAGGTEMLRYPALPAGTYYVTVDGFESTDVGAYNFTVTASTPGCGDGVISGTEECDDGNTANGDRCSSTCVLEADVTDTEPNDATPQVLTAGNHIIRGTYSDTDVDLYSFTLAAPATVEIESYYTINGTPLDYSGVGSGRLFDCAVADAPDPQIALFDSTGDVTDNTTALAVDEDDGAGYCSYLGAADGDGDDTQLVDLPAGTYTLKLELDEMSLPAATPQRYVLDLKITTAANAPVGPAAGDLKINEFLPADGPTFPDSDSNCDGSVAGTSDEFVELVNVSTKTLDLTGVTVWDSTTTAARFTFALAQTGSMLLAPGKSVVVWGGGNPACTGVTNYFTTANDTLGLNDSGGDMVIVKSADATPVTIASTSYTTTTAGISLNLSPDVTGTSYATHNTITGHVGNYSPGKKVDGTSF